MLDLSRVFRFRSLAFFAILTAPLVACGLEAEEDDGIGSIEQEKRVKPNGEEKHTTGTVVVKVPANAPPLANTTVELHPDGFNATVVKTNLATAATVPVGRWNVRIAGSTATTVFATIEVKGGQTTDITLPVLAPVERTTPAAPGSATASDFTWGPRFTPVRPAPVQQAPLLRLVGENAIYANPIGASAGIVLAPGRKYEIVRRNGPGGGEDILHAIDVAGAPKVYTAPAVADIWIAPVFDVPQSELTFVIEPSDFKPAVAPEIEWTCSNSADNTRNYSSPAEHKAVALRTTAQPSAAGTVVGRVGTPGCSYALNLAGGPIALATSSPQLTTTIHFLDIEHVHLTHENGTTRDVPGKVKLSRIPGPGQAPNALTDFIFDTERALPVAAGTYLIEVRYTDNANATKIYREQVTVP